MSDRIKLSIVIIILVAVFAAIGFFATRQVGSDLAGKNNSSEVAAKIKVLTTFLPIYVFTKNVAGDAAEVENLLPPGVGPHDYSFTPADVIKVSRAKVLVENGVGLEEWIEDIIKSAAAPDLILIDTSKGIDLLKEETAADVSSKAGVAEEEADVHGEFNPHIWLDPILAVKQVENIRDGLILADPLNSAVYAQNAEIYIQKLNNLSAAIASSSANFKENQFIAFHDAFPYFSRRYGLKQTATIEPFPGKEPSVRYIADIIDLIKKENIKALFSEPQFSPRIVETISRDLGITVYVLDTLENGEYSLDFYEKTMLQNLETLKQALGYDEPPVGAQETTP